MTDTSSNHNGIQLFCRRGMVFAFCAMIFFLPISIAVMDSLAGVVIFLYCVKKIHGLMLRRAGLSPTDNVLKKPIAILTLAVFLSVVQSQFFVLSLFAFFGKFLKVVLLYFSFVETFTDRKQVRLFLSVFLVSSLLIGLDGLVQHWWGMDLLARHHLPADGRISSSFKFANSFGVYLIVALSIAVQQTYACFTGQRRSLWLQASLVFLLFVLLFCLTWTFSRASWVGFISAVIFMVFLDKRKILYLTLLLSVFICFSMPLLKEVRHVSLIKDTVNSNAAISDANASGDIKQSVENFLFEGGSGRIHFWKSAICIIKKYPLCGSGLNTYAVMLKRFSLPQWYAHNSYLQMAAETGVLGLCCFLWMIFILFKKAGEASGRGLDPGFKGLFQGSLAGLFGFLVGSFLDNSLYAVQLVILFWLMMALTVAVMNLTKNEKL